LLQAATVFRHLPERDATPQIGLRRLLPRGDGVFDNPQKLPFHATRTNKTRGFGGKSP
jgi:hypothetical protein